MSKTFIQEGAVLTFPAPSGGVVAGTPLLVGTKVFIPRVTAAQTVVTDFDWCGVHLVTKADSQAWTVGAAIYWDDTAKNFTTTSSANTAAGFVVEAVAATGGLTTGKVMLNGVCA